MFDLVGHLCGRPVPGIPLASTLPTCPVDRVRQIHWMYCTLLTFLRYEWTILPFIKFELFLEWFFHLVSRVIHLCFGFALLRSVIG